MNRRTLPAATGALLGSSLLERAGVESAPNNGTPLKSASDSAAETFNLFDFEALARQRIPHPAYEYIAGGAADEITLRWNREAFDALALRPRVLVDIERIDTSVELFGATARVSGSSRADGISSTGSPGRRGGDRTRG